MLFRFVIVFSLMLSFALPAHAARHALLIGVSDYGGSGFLNLDGTINYVELVRGMLKDHFGFKEGDILMLKNSEASEGVYGLAEFCRSRNSSRNANFCTLKT